MIKTEKETLLTRLQTDRQTLLKTIEGVPNEALAAPNAVGSWSVLDVLAHITAWDGEMLRRIAFASGDHARPPHDVRDEIYWLTWNDKQVEIKRIMGARGIKVDLAGTWVRLLAQIEALPPPDYARWLEMDPRALQRHDVEHAQQLQQWREQWERSLPWWRKVGRRIRRYRINRR